MSKNLTLVFLAAALTLSAADNYVGTWKANLAKSKYSPGPAPKSDTVTYTQDGDSIVATNEFVDSEGKPTTVTNRWKRDGTEYPFTTPAGNKGTVIVKSINATTSEATLKVGTATTNIRSVMASDGKSFTRTATGTNAKGQKVNNVVVFEKQ
jgi:hypothetical protein